MAAPYDNDGLSKGVETFVFEYETPEQREQLFALIKPLWENEDGLRVTGISRDNELRRVELLTEAAERFDDHYDMREVQQEIFGCPDLSKWTWDDAEDAA